MPFGSRVLKQVITEIRFPPTMLYHEKRISVCYGLTDVFPHWALDIGKVEMYTTMVKEDSEFLFSVTNRGASLLKKNMTQFEDFRTLTQRVFREITDEFRISTLARVGIRFFYLVSYDGSFESLRDIIFQKIYQRNAVESLTRNPIDVAFVINFEEHNTKFNLISGPVTKGELRERLAEPKGEFFDVALLADLDCYLTDSPFHRVNSFLRESYNNSLEIFQRVQGFLEG